MTGFRIDTATSPPQLTIVDFEELILNEAPANSIAMFRRGAILPQPGFFGTTLWSLSGPGGKNPVVLNGYKYRRTNGTALQQSTFTVGSGLNHPMGEDVAAEPPGRSHPTRWTVGQVMTFIGPVVGVAALNLLGTTSEMGGGGAQGFEISANPGVNGGNWTIRRRLLPLFSAIIDVDTGIPGSTEVYAEIIYESTDNPTLFARVNGAEFGRVQGLVNIPRLEEGIGGLDTWFLNSTGGFGVASFQAFRAFRVIVEELPGFV